MVNLTGLKKIRPKTNFLPSKAFVYLFVAISCFAYESLLLDIPGRKQWNFSGGYCGSCSIQMAALYYGSYVSQDRVRKSIGDLEILFGSRMRGALDSLSFEWDEYDEGSDIKKYFIWLKENLHDKTPIIVATKHGQARYHHIILIVGYTCDDISTYNDDDTLFYNECYHQTLAKSFKTWQDNTLSNYFDPDRHYGYRVSGIKDTDNETVPVQLFVDKDYEPEPDENPISVNAEIRIRSLTIGKTYLLLKYTDHTKVPSSNFCNDSDFIFKKFVATHDTAEFSDSFMNNETAIFRCVPDNSVGIHTKPPDEIASDRIHLKLLNPTTFSFSIAGDAYVEVSVYNCQGQIVLSPIRTYLNRGNYTLNPGFSSLTNGTYYLGISTGTYNKVRKLLICR